MPAPKNPALYEQLYFDIAEAIKESQRELTLPFSDKKAAEQVRMKFYRFRAALGRASRKEEDAQAAREYAELFSGVEYTRVFLEKQDGNYVLAFRHSRITVDPSLEKAQSVLQQELMKRKRENMEKSGETGIPGINVSSERELSRALPPSSEDAGASYFDMFDDGED